MTDQRRTELVLDEQLCFALYAASRAMTAAYRARLAVLDITYTQYLVLLALWEHEQLSLGELGDRVQLDGATLSPVAKRLERAGLIERRRRVEDERVIDLTCTDAGHALRPAIGEVQRDVERTVGLTYDELVDLRETLRSLTAHLRQHTDRTSDAGGKS